MVLHSDPLYGMRSFASNPVNSHELVVGGAGTHYHIVNASQGKIVKRVSRAGLPYVKHQANKGLYTD